MTSPVKHFLRLSDVGAEGILAILNDAAQLKAARGKVNHPKPLAHKSVALIFEKPSTRTRVSFELAAVELGGTPVVISAKDSQLGRGEPIEDTIRLLSRYVHAVMYRTSGHERLERMRQHSTIPVINGLTDKFHPCQLLADLMTVQEALQKPFKGLSVAWIGDGNNMAHSWMEAAALLDFDLRLSCPTAYAPDKVILEECRAWGKGKIQLLQDPKAACQGAHVVTTDVWASMGQEDEGEARKKAFAEYKVNAALLKAAHPQAVFLHCLPAHRGEEVDADVIDGPQSRVWDEAENRLHAQKALLQYLIA